MKAINRILFVVAMIGGATAVTSCKKQHTCECVRTYTKSNGTIIIEPDGNYTFEDNKFRAKERCADQEGSGADLSGEYTRNCEIK